jgi:hypothetical protein
MASTAALVAGLQILAAVPAAAQGPNYHGKVTIGEYQTSGDSSMDMNVRYSRSDWTAWLGYYSSSDIREGRTGIEYDFRKDWLYVVPSAQAATKGFLGGTVYAEVGRRIYAIAGLSRTNLKPYVNLTFDPNDSWQAGAGMHFNDIVTIGLFTIWDNRLGTGQQITHAFVRRRLGELQRLTLDTSYKSGRGDDLMYVSGVAVSVEYDMHRWFVKIAGDQHANFGPDTMYRFGGGLRV